METFLSASNVCFQDVLMPNQAGGENKCILHQGLLLYGRSSKGGIVCPWWVGTLQQQPGFLSASPDFKEPNGHRISSFKDNIHPPSIHT
jgi:hypothetical protein